MTDLSEFLLERIAEDEATAGRWHDRECDFLGNDFDEDTDCRGPARVLAECDAKRRIVNSAPRGYRMRSDVSYAMQYRAIEEADGTAWVEMRGTLPAGTPSMLPREEFMAQFMEPEPPSQVLRLLAMPYADHPDYDEAWRP